MDNKNDEDSTGKLLRQPVRKQKRSRVRPLFVWLLIIVLLLSNGVLGYFWYSTVMQRDDLQRQKTQLEQQVSSLREKLAIAEAAAAPEAETDTTPCSEDPSDSLKENIKAALDTQNTAVFETYTTDPVFYVLAASEYGGNVSPTEAATSLEYTHSATGPWDFNLPAATIAAYDAGYYTDYFDENTYVGRSTDGMVVAFDFACGDKIKQIFVAAHEDIL